jgi:transposase InsO family protein
MRRFARSPHDRSANQRTQAERNTSFPYATDEVVNRLECQRLLPTSLRSRPWPALGRGTSGMAAASAPGSELLEQVLRVYVEHYNSHRPHRALGLEPPASTADVSVVRDGQPRMVRRRDLLGGLLHEYHRQAA